MVKIIKKQHHKKPKLKDINECYKFAISIATVDGLLPTKDDLKIFKEYLYGKITYSKYMTIIENKYRKN